VQASEVSLAVLLLRLWLLLLLLLSRLPAGLPACCCCWLLITSQSDNNTKFLISRVDTENSEGLLFYLPLLQCRVIYCGCACSAIAAVAGETTLAVSTTRSQHFAWISFPEETTGP
jgi:hypothetical protein